MFNVKKCSVLHFGKSNGKSVYNMNNIELASETVIRDLGSTISGLLKYGEHNHMITANANNNN